MFNNGGFYSSTLNMETGELYKTSPFQFTHTKTNRAMTLLQKVDFTGKVIKQIQQNNQRYYITYNSHEKRRIDLLNLFDQRHLMKQILLNEQRVFIIIKPSQQEEEEVEDSGQYCLEFDRKTFLFIDKHDDVTGVYDQVVESETETTVIFKLDPKAYERQVPANKAMLQLPRGQVVKILSCVSNRPTKVIKSQLDLGWDFLTVEEQKKQEMKVKL